MSYIEAIYGQLPSGWKMATIGDLVRNGDAQLQTGPFGTMLHASAYRETGTPVVAVQHIGENRLVRRDMPRLDSETESRLSRYKLRVGDIIFGRKGAVDRRALIRNDEEGWLQGSDCIRLRFLTSAVDPVFISHLLGTAAYRNWILRHAHGATMPSLNQEIIGLVPLPLPPVNEQQDIGRLLSLFDEKIELNKRMNDTLEAIAKAIFKSWFLDFDLLSTPGETATRPAVPKDWSLHQLGELCEVGRGASPRPIQEYMGGTVPWIKIADATAADGPFIFETAEHVTMSGAERSVRVSPGDLILSNSATCGLPVFVDLEGCIHDGWLYFRNLRLISRIYLYQVLKEISEHLIQIADGSVQKNLNTHLVRSQQVIVPPGRLLRMFDDAVKPIFDLIRDNGRQSRTLAAVRDALLPKLITGEIRLKGAERIVEAQV